jgi:hypothetical protein
LDRPPEGADGSREGDGREYNGKTWCTEHAHCRHPPIRVLSGRVAQPPDASDDSGLFVSSYCAGSSTRGIFCWPLLEPMAGRSETQHWLSHRQCRPRGFGLQQGSQGAVRLNGRAGARGADRAAAIKAAHSRRCLVRFERAQAPKQSPMGMVPIELPCRAWANGTIFCRAMRPRRGARHFAVISFAAVSETLASRHQTGRTIQ